MIASTDGAGLHDDVHGTDQPLDTDDADPATATMTNPGANLHGTIALGATGADAGSGIDTVAIQHTPAGGFTWTTVCTDAVVAVQLLARHDHADRRPL